MKDKVKKISAKKITLLILVSLLAALILAAGLFFGISSCTSGKRAVPDLKEGYTVRKTAPTDGSLPTDHSGLDNIGYMAYVLDNQQSYHAYANNSTKSTGYEQITQTWKDYKSAAANGTANNVMVCSDLSYSSLVKASTQTCFVGDKNAYMRTGNKPGKNSLPADISWNTDQPSGYTDETYRKKYGEFSTELSVYVINADTVVSCDEVTDNGDGTYSQKFYLGEDAAVWYRNGMKTRGSLKTLPEFEKIEITFTFDSKWQVLSSYCEEKAKISPSALGGVSMGSSSKTTTTFDYSEAGFDNEHFANYKKYYEKYVGQNLTDNPSGNTDEPAILDVLGGGFNKVVDANGNGQRFTLGLKLGQTEYVGRAYAKLGDMGDILGSLDIRLALEKKDSGKQDLFVEFSGGELNVYYSDSFALLVNIDRVADSVSKITEWISGLDGKVEAQDIAYALSEDNGEAPSGLDSLIAAVGFTYTDTSACISLDTDDLLGLGIGVDAQLNFSRVKEEDGSTYSFINASIGSITYKSTPINLSFELLPYDGTDTVSHDKSQASADLADYINGVYGLLNSKTYLIDLSLDGTSTVKYLGGLELTANAQVKQEKGFKEISVNVPVSVKYGKLSVELEAFYTVNLENKDYGTVYLYLKEISGKQADAKVYCNISDTVDAVKKLINRFKADDGAALLSEDGETDKEVNTVANVINMVLGLDYGKIITELKANENEIGITVDVDEILGALDTDLGVEFGQLALTLVNGEKASLRATLSELGLALGVSGSDGDITVPDEKEYADLTAYINGVYGLLDCETIIVGIKLDGTSEIKYLSGVMLEAEAQLKLENGYNVISVNVPLTVKYNDLSVELEIFYTVNLENGNYGEVYLNIVSINAKPYGMKVYCDIGDTVNAVKELINLINGNETVQPLTEDNENNETVDKLANIINAVINIDYASIINEITANPSQIKFALNADEVLKALKFDLNGIELGTLSLGLSLDGNKNATLNGNLSALGLNVGVNGSENKLAVPDKSEYLNVIEFIDIIGEAVRQAQAIIEARDIEFNVDGVVTVDGVSMSVKGAGEVVWKENAVRVAVDLTLAIAEKENAESVEVKFVYDETSNPLVRFTVNELGLEIYANDIDGIADLINEIKGVIGGIVGAGAQTTAYSLDGEAVEEEAIDFTKLLGVVLDTVSKVTVGLQNSEADGATVRDILISYADKGNLLLGANGALSLVLSSDVISINASVKAGDGAKLEEINYAMDGDKYNFYTADTFTRAVYDYVLDLLDNLSIKNLLGSSTYSVEVTLNGNASGIAALKDINVNAQLHYTENDSKLIEADLGLDIKGTQVIAKAYYTERTVYVALENVAGVALTDIAFKVSTDNIYEAAATLVELITSETLAEILGKFIGQPVQALSLDENGGEEAGLSLTKVINFILTLDMDSVIKYEPVSAGDTVQNTLMINPDVLLEAFGSDIRIGTVYAAVNPETHSVYASVTNDGTAWITFNAQAVEGGHASPDPDKFIDIGFIATLLDDIKTTLENTQRDESGVLSVLYSFTGDININVKISGLNLSTIEFKTTTLTLGLDAENDFYFSLVAELQGSIATTQSWISVTYSDNYITFGRDVKSDNPKYKVMTLDYLLGNLMDNIFWLLDTNGLVKGIIKAAIGSSLDSLGSSLTKTEDFYLYDDSLNGNGTKEEMTEFNLSQYLSGLAVRIGEYTSGYGNSDGVASAVSEKFGLTDNYYAASLDLSSVIGKTLRNIYAAIVRDGNGGIKGLDAYLEIESYLFITAKFDNGMTYSHADNYFKTASSKYNINFNNFEGFENKTFGCYNSSDNTYEALDINRPYRLTVYGFDGNKEYGAYELGDKLILEKTLNSGSRVHLFEEEMWLDEAHTRKLIYVDNNGNDLGLTFIIKADTEIYQMIAGGKQVTFHTPYGDEEKTVFVGAELPDPATKELDGKTFAGWYLDDKFTKPVFVMQPSANDYYAQYVDTSYTAENGVVYTFVKDGSLTAGYYTASFLDKNRADKDYSLSSNTLMLADSINGFPVTAIAKDAFNYNKTGVRLKKIIVPESIVTVGAQAFMDNKDMELAVFLAETVYFGGSTWDGDTRFPFYGCGKDSDNTVTALDLYYNFAKSENDNTDWFGFNRSGNSVSRKYQYIGDNGGSRNGSRIDHNGTRVNEGSAWSYVVFELAGDKGGYTAADLGLAEYYIATSGEYDSAATEAAVKALLDNVTAQNGYINAYSVNVSGDISLANGRAVLTVTLTEDLANAWYELTVETNYNGNRVTVEIDSDEREILIEETQTTVTYYVKAGSTVKLNALAAESGIYEFEGWIGLEAENATGITLNMPAGVTDIKAKWGANVNENIYVVSEIGFTYNNELQSAGGDYLKKAVVNDNLASPVAAGYQFLGWAVYDETSGLYLAENTLIESDTAATYYALWAAAREDVTFSLNGTTVTASVNDGYDGSVYGWYGGSDSIFAGGLLSEGADYTFTTEHTAVQVRLQYTLTVTVNGTKCRQVAIGSKETSQSTLRGAHTLTETYTVYEGEVLYLSQSENQKDFNIGKVASDNKKEESMTGQINIRGTATTGNKAAVINNIICNGSAVNFVQEADNNSYSYMPVSGNLTYVFANS